MRSRNKLQYNYKRCHMYCVYRLCRWHTEKCDLYYNGDHGVYSLCTRIHLQYHHERCDLYNLCGCLCRGNNLSVNSLYSNNEQGLLNVLNMSCWNTEKCYLYCSIKYRMYSLYSGILLQYNDKCCFLYCLLNLCCGHLCVYCLLNHCE